VTVTSSGATPLNLLILGSNVTVALSTTSPSTDQLVIVGNYDNVNIINGAVSTIDVYAVGIHDGVDVTTSSGKLTLVSTFFGSSDTVVVGAISGTGNLFDAFFTGFQPQSPTAVCPVDNLASGDTVSGGSAASGTYSATYNDTSSVNPTVPSPWVRTLLTPTIPCPFFSQTSVTFAPGLASAGFRVHLVNTYLPQADIAFDEGGVVFAQPGGVPVMIDGPAISAVQLNTGALTSVSIWFPVFVGTLPTDSGVSTTEISTRLISLDTVVLTPSTTLGVASNSNISLTITTPFAAAWGSYFESMTAFDENWTCSGPSAACNGPYTSGGPLGTVVLSIPTGTQLTDVNIQVATFAISLI
jgi:hypothetical protein